MKILFTRFPLESAYGGAEVQILSLMKGLLARGHEVEFVGSCETLITRCPTFAKATAGKQMSGIRYQELQIGPPPVTKWGAMSFLWRRKRMQKLLMQSLQATSYKLQAIIMLSLTEKLLLTRWCTTVGMRVIWLEHDRVGRWLTWNPWLPMLRKLSRAATTVVVSSKSADIYRALRWQGEILTIPNGIDTSRFTENDRKTRNYKLETKNFRLGCIARLTHDKGVDLLIEAIQDLHDVSLSIIGSGRKENALRKQANSYQLKAISFQRNANNICDFYHSLDCLILPSRSHDPFGLVVAEAMACGIPTICTDACGIAGYLTDKDSLIVRAGYAATLKEAIVKLKNNPDLCEKLAKRGPEVARKRFSLERMIADYESLLLQKK